MGSQQAGDKQTLLGMYLSCEHLDTKDVVTIVSDMLLAGIETVHVKSVDLFSTQYQRHPSLFKDVQQLATQTCFWIGGICLFSRARV